MKPRSMPPGDQPPLFSTWTAWYVLVLLVLALLIAGFSVFTNYFS